MSLMFRPSEVAAGHFDKGVLDAFWIAGDEPHSQVGATPFQLPEECLSRLSLKLPSEWKIDPARIISYQQITPSEISPYSWQLYLTNCSDPIFLTPIDEEVLKLFLSPDWITFDQELGFKLSELIALEFREETTLYARLFLKHGPLLLLPLTPEKKTRLLQLVQTSEWTAVSPSLYVQLQACVAFRQAYAGDSGARDWLLYGGRQHYLEVGADPKTVSRLQKQVNALKWRSSSNSGWFDANQQTAYVYEPARVEQFDPRLGIYFKGGHEVNVYDKTDVADLREKLNEWTSRPSVFQVNDLSAFELSRVVCYRKREGLLPNEVWYEVSLINGPGITLREEKSQREFLNKVESERFYGQI